MSVTAGNVQLGTATSSTGATINGTTYAGNQGVIQIPIETISSSASTIKIAAPVVTLDNTVPEGSVIFKIEGTAVNQTYTALFPNDTVAASVTAANVGNGVATTTATQPNGAVVFTIGQSNYTVNGTSVNMDVAPYIKDSRTFVPLRAVANALGVSDSNIIWDPTSDKVTIIKGSLVAQFTIGSTMMLLNGAAITMDTAPEITDGRTCLPIAWAAQALGVSYTWDGTVQTVTFGTGAGSASGSVAPAPSGGSAPAATTTTTTPAQ